MKKLFSLLTVLLLSISLFGCDAKVDVTANQKAFDEYVQKEFIDTITSDYTTLKLVYENPKENGIDDSDVEVNLGERPKENDNSELKKSFEELKKIDYKSLDEKSKDLYDAIYFHLEHNVVMNDEKYSYYNQILTSMGGIHTAILTYLSDMLLKNEEDVKDFVLLLKDVKPYLESSIEYVKVQYEKGYLLMDKDEVLSTIQRTLDSGTNGSIIKNTSDKLDKLGLKDQYLDEIIKIYKDEVLPSFKSLYDLVDSFDEDKFAKAYADLPDGREYFKHVLSLSVGSDKKVNEIKEMCLDGIQESATDLVELISNGNINPEELDFSFTTKYDSYEAIMKDILEKMKDDFPDIGKIDYEIQALNEDLASTSGVAAYFNIPSIDTKSPRQLRVNPLIGSINEYNVYNTVAHEGFPGHMYQYAYAVNNFHPLLTHIIGSLPYTEGYAVYASYEANRYLDDANQDLLEMVRISEILNYYIIILADIGIHYEGWTTETFDEFMSDYFGDTDLSDLYDQLRSNPAAFENYYIGYKEIIGLKDKAKDKLGDNFSEKGFNEALLSAGNTPFKVVERHIDKYINDNK